MHPSLSLPLKVEPIPVEEVPTLVEQSGEQPPLITEETAAPLADEAPVAVNGAVPVEQELEQEVLPKIASNQVEVKSEKIETSSGHADVSKDALRFPRVCL